MELFIPSKIDRNSKYGKGIGSKEFRKTVLSGVISLPIALIICSMCFKEFQIVLLASVASSGLIVCLATVFFKKIISGRSVYDILRYMIFFLKEQQLYKYKKLKEWF